MIFIDQIHNNFQSQIMHAHRKHWNQKEDQILKFLREERGEKKWSVIALKMEQQFGIKNKTGKKCRQRYVNHLNPNVQNSIWNVEEDKILLKLHQQYGNKWSIIAQNIVRKSENCVKNRFYSKIRKNIRKLNHFIAKNQNLQISAVSQAVICKIISVCESRFQIKCIASKKWIQFCMEIIAQMYNLQTDNSKNQIKQEQQIIYLQIINKIAQFQLHFKKNRYHKNQEDYKGRNFSRQQSKSRQVKKRIRQKKEQKYVANIEKKSPKIHSNEKRQKQNEQSFKMAQQAEENSIQISQLYQSLKINLVTFENYEQIELHQNRGYLSIVSFPEYHRNEDSLDLNF